VYKRRERSNHCRQGSADPGPAISFCASQTTIVFVVVLLQNRTIDRLFPAARAGNVFLSKGSVLAAKITEQRKVFVNILCLFHVIDPLPQGQLKNIATKTRSHKVL
jgi:hypothetical protein